MELDTTSETVRGSALGTREKILSFPIEVLPTGAEEFRRHYEQAAPKAGEQITVEMHDNTDGSLATIGILINMRRNIDEEVTICLQNCQPKVKYLLNVLDGGEGFIFNEGLLA